MTFQNYLKGWKVGQLKTPQGPLWAAVPKQTNDPIGKRITAGTQETLMWLLEMNYKDTHANVHVS